MNIEICEDCGKSVYYFKNCTKYDVCSICYKIICPECNVSKNEDYVCEGCENKQNDV